MTNVWRLDGRDLDDTNVIVKAVQGRMESSKRIALHDTFQGTQVLHNTGRDLPVRTLGFTFLNHGTAEYYDTFDAIADIMDSDGPFVLQAPDDAVSPVKAYKASNHAWVEPSGWDERDQRGRGSITMEAEFVVLGIPQAADASSTDELVYTGHFTFDGTDYTREDGVNTGTTPLFRVEEQIADYPTATRNSDFATVDLGAPDSTTNVTDFRGTYTVEDYDMTGFLTPAPASAGDAGLYKVYANQTLDALNWTT